MKTRELAKSLSFLAKLLRQLPNAELENQEGIFENSSSLKLKKVSQKELPNALYTLVALNDLPKCQWLQLIEDFDFDIEIRPRDGIRDVSGKILNYLKDNPDAREKLVFNKTKKKAVSPSSNLAEALTLLIK